MTPLLESPVDTGSGDENVGLGVCVNNLISTLRSSFVPFHLFCFSFAGSSEFGIGWIGSRLRAPLESHYNGPQLGGSVSTKEQ